MAVSVEKGAWRMAQGVLVKKHEQEMSAVYNTRHPAKKAPPPAGTGASSENQ
jgi:hypothetical protein